MALRLLEEQIVEAQIAVVGSSEALAHVWAELRRLATLWRGDLELVVPERAALEPAVESGVPLRLVFHRCALPGPDAPEVDLLASILSPLSPEPGASLPLDGLLVAVDLMGPTAGQSRPLLRVVENVLALLSEGPPLQSTLPRALVGVGRGPGADFWQEAGTAMWAEHPDAMRLVTPGLTPGELKGLLRHLTEHIRHELSVRPPLSEPFTPGADLPGLSREEGARLVRETEDDVGSARDRAAAYWRLGQLYARAGRMIAGDRLARLAFAEPDAAVWDALPAEVTPVAELRCLRSWMFPPALAGGVALIDDGQACVLALGDKLLRLERHAPEPQTITTLGDGVHVLRAVGQDRVVLVGRRIRLVDGHTGKVIGEEDLERHRRRLEREATDESAQRSPLPRVSVHRASDRLLVAFPGGVLVFALSTLAYVGRLPRGDLVAAAFEDGWNVVTIHAGGMIGRWQVGTTIIQRVANLRGPAQDGWLAMGARRAAVLVGSARPGPRLQLIDLTDGTELGACSTRNGTSVRLSEDGRRVMTLEHRLLRVRDVGDGLADDTDVVTLFDPPPWMPLHVDVPPNARSIAVLARTMGGKLPLRLNLWG